MTRSFEVTYQQNILDRVNVRKTKLETKSAQVLEFTYDGDFPKEIVFVLNPNWEGLLHGLSLNEIPFHQFKLIIKQIQATDEDTIQKRLSESSVPVVDMVDNPKLFYETKLKNNHVFRKYKGYKTYDWKKIKNIEILTLDFRDLIEYPDPLVLPSGKVL